MKEQGSRYGMIEKQQEEVTSFLSSGVKRGQQKVESIELRAEVFDEKLLPMVFVECCRAYQ